MRYFLTLFLAVMFHLGTNAQKFIPAPNPPRLVVDNANVLSEEQKEILEKKLVALDDSTSNQIAILTIATLNGESIEDVAINTFRNWKIGSKTKNNGILIIVAIAERKIRIEVGYGLEGAIPDIVANSIIEQNIKPNFKQKNYFGGFDDAIDNLSKAAVGEYKVARERRSSDEKSNGVGSFLGIIIIVLILLFISRRGGGGGGRGRNDGDFLTPLLLSSLLNNSSSGGGGFYQGGGGGDSGGGDFGGFGGGDSGGGGASGSW